MACIIKDGRKFYSQISLEEVLFVNIKHRKAKS